MDIQFENLNAQNSGLERAFQDALKDVMSAINDQDIGNRKDGAIKCTFGVVFERRGGGVILAIESSTKIPPRVCGDGRYASLTPDGKFMVDTAQQADLPFDNTVPFQGKK